MRPSGSPDQNYKPSTILWDNVNDTTFAQEGNKTIGAGFVQILDNGGTPITSFGGSASGLDLPAYDYVAYVNVSATADRYVFKTGGSGGATVATINIVYVDSTKDQISTVTKT